MPLYRYKDASGQTTYSDRAPMPGETASSVEVLRNGAVVKSAPAKEENPHAEARGHIKSAQRHIPKVQVYIEYIEYLRKYQPQRYQEFVREILANDPQTHAKLLRTGLFQPLKPDKRLSLLMEGGVAVMGDLFSGRSGASGVMTYAEKTLVELMKRDRLISPDVLGSKASTLPSVVTNYSNSKLGQWSKMEDLRMAAMGKQTQSALTGRPVLSAAATAATRVAGPVLDVMIGALDPQVAAGLIATVGLKVYDDKLKEKGIILFDDEKLELRGHLARKDWVAARNLVREAALRSEK